MSLVEESQLFWEPIATYRLQHSPQWDVNADAIASFIS